jgi:hypothetical protein
LAGWFLGSSSSSLEEVSESAESAELSTSINWRLAAVFLPCAAMVYRP